MEYFIYKDNRQQGPFTTEQLSAMGLTSETLVWREGMEQWTPAWQVQELRDAIAGKANPSGTTTPPPPPVAESGDAGNDGTEDESTRYAGPQAAPPRDGRRHRRAVKWLAAIAVVFFILLMTCPKEDKHYDTVAREVTEAVVDSTAKLDTGFEAIDMLGGMLGREIAGQFVGAMVTQVVKVDNYFIFSVGRVEYAGRSEVISLGIAGHVFTFGSDDLRKALRKLSPLPDTMAL